MSAPRALPHDSARPATKTRSMNEPAAAIIANLDTVARLRALLAADASLQARAHAIKRYQGVRFERTYADWLADAHAARACRFFLDEIYGPRDFSQRDAQFARVVPALTRLFPGEVIHTVTMLSELHALSETMDKTMATHVPEGATMDAPTYHRAWQATGQPDTRERQVRLMHDVGSSLVAYTRRPMMRTTLRVMRGPAAAAGLSALQHFLEEGFESFAALPDPKRFLGSVAQRERSLCARLDESLTAQPRDADDPLGQLP
jgi:hypothetical protein